VRAWPLLLWLSVTLLVPATAAAQETQEEAAAEEELVLAQPPELRELVPAEIPAGTVFPQPVVSVLLRFEVDPAGRVAKVEIVEGAGEPFDSAAAAAARASRFSPGVLNTGEKVPVTVSLRIRIEEPPPPPPEPVRFRGLLLERGTRRPLREVAVAARAPVSEGGDNAPRGEVLVRSSSDGEGRFELEVPAADFVLVAVPPGHERLEVTVDAEPGEERDETFYLESIGGDQVTIVRAGRIRREVTRRVLPREAVRKLAGTAGDTLKVVESLPGTARTPFSGGQLILRGANPGDSRVFLEGHEIPQIYHFGGLRSTYNSALLDRIEFMPGNFGSQYGRATGGVVEVRVRDPDAEMLHGEVDVNTYDAGFVLEGPLGGDWAMAGAFHRSYIDAILPAVIPDDADLSFDTAPRYYDYQVTATYTPSSRQKLRLIGFGSNDKLRLIFDDPQGDPKVRGALSAGLSFYDLIAAHELRISPTLRQKISAFVTWERFSFQIGPDFFFELDSVRPELLGEWTFDLLSNLELRAGVDLRLIHYNIRLDTPLAPKEGDNDLPVSALTFIERETGGWAGQHGAYVDLKYEPSEGLVLMPGVRVDGYTLGKDALTVDPRFSARYRVLPATAVKAGVGLYQQPPDPDETDEVFGNPELLPKRSVHLSVGVEQEVSDLFDLDVTGFYKLLDRVVVRNPEYRGEESDEVPYTNDGEGRIFGLEVLLRLQPGRDLYGWIAYTFQRSFRTDRPGETRERPFDFDQPHILTLLAGYDLPRGWSVGARFRFVSGNPDTPVVDAVYDSANDVWVPIYGESNSDRLGPFHQLDVRVDKVWTFQSWKLNLYADVQNVYNHGNPEGWIYNHDYSERTTLSGLPILPILGLRGSW